MSFMQCYDPQLVVAGFFYDFEMVNRLILTGEGQEAGIADG